MKFFQRFVLCPIYLSSFRLLSTRQRSNWKKIYKEENEMKSNEFKMNAKWDVSKFASKCVCTSLRTSASVVVSFRRWENAVRESKTTHYFDCSCTLAPNPCCDFVHCTTIIVNHRRDVSYARICKYIASLYLFRITVEEWANERTNERERENDKKKH